MEERIKLIIQKTNSQEYSRTDFQFLNLVLNQVNLQLYDGVAVLYIGSTFGQLVTAMSGLIGTEGKVIVVDDDIQSLERFKQEIKKAHPEGITKRMIKFIPTRAEMTYDIWKHGPFNAIVVECLLKKDVPVGLIQILQCGGKLIIPVEKNGNVVLEIHKKHEDGTMSKEDLKHVIHDFFATVPWFPLPEKNFIVTFEIVEKQRVDIKQLSKQIKESVECPVCYDIMEPPTVMCVNGHTTGSECRPKLVECPVCRGPFTSIKNINIEGILCDIRDKVSYVEKCQGRVNGCLIEERDISEHEKNCEFRKWLKCSHCDKEVVLAVYGNHIRTEHTDILVLNLNCSVNLETCGIVHKVWFLVDCLTNLLFEVYLIANDENVWTSVRYIGSKKQVSRLNMKCWIVGGNVSLVHTLPVLSQDVSYDMMESSPNFDIDKNSLLELFQRSELEIRYELIKSDID